MAIRISIGANREVLLKLADDIRSTFAEGKVEQSLTLWGKENIDIDDESLVTVEISFSNEDMEDRDDLPADAVFVDVDEV